MADNKVTTEDLVYREYWTPQQTARVLGRGQAFWRLAFDQGLIDGYVENLNGAGRKYRYLRADSARALLERRITKRTPVAGHTGRLMADFRASLREE